MEKDRANMYEEAYEAEEIVNDETMNDSEDMYEEEYEEEYEEAYGEDEEAVEDEASEEEDFEEEDSEESEDDDGIDLDELNNFANLFGYLQMELTRYASNVPLTTKKLVDTTKCLNILNDMKLSLPATVKYCWRVYEEKDRILDRSESIANSRVENAKIKAEETMTNAKEEEAKILSAAQRRSKNIISDAEARADAILKEAAARAQRMVNESEIVQRAKSEANIRIENARVEARERRLRAVNDAYRLLDALEKQTLGITEAIARKKEEMTVKEHD